MKMENEIWKPIPKYERYLASNLGRVKSPDNSFIVKGTYVRFRAGVILKPKTNRNGYLSLCVFDDKSNRKQGTVHRFVAFAFIPNPDNKPHINHKNGVKTDNRVENLEWCTPKENDTHARETGLYVNRLHGENSGTAILTNEIVLKIRDMHKNSGLSQREIGRRLNIEYKNINQIVLRKRWKHI